MASGSRFASREESARTWLRRAVLVWLTLNAHVSLAQDDPSSDWSNTPGSRRTSAACVPECRSGYRCSQGECLPICSPPCDEGYLCVAGGQCVALGTDARSAPPAPVATPQRTPSGVCEPECRAGYMCLHGQCVSACNPVCGADEICTAEGECAPRPAEQPVAAVPVERRDPSADSRVNLHLNAVGPLQFGLNPTIELGKKWSGYLSVTPLNTGMSCYLLLGHDQGDRFRWGLAATVGTHVFFLNKGNMRGLYAGAALGYAFVRTQDKKYDLANYATHVLIPQVDVGYRWAFGNFLLGLGAQFGVSVPVAHWDHAIGANGCVFADSCNGHRRAWFLPGVVLDVGWFL
jgi:hypothetical protein